MDFVKAHKKLLGIVAFVVVLVIVAVSFYNTVNGTRGTVITKENALIAQYKDNQNELSTYILQFNESLGIADRQSDKLNEIILDAVKGRYDNDTSLQPGTGGAMFSAIAEAYPDLTATTELYAQVQELVVSGRNAYKNKQSKLLDLIRDYNTYLNQDIFRSWVIDTFIDAPTEDNLVIVDAGVTYKGEDALEQISQIVLTQDAVDAYESGTQNPLITPSEDDK